MTQRIEKLLQNRYMPFEATSPPLAHHFSGGVRWGGEPFHDAWMVHAGEPHFIRLAHAIVAQWLGSRMIIEPEELIVGRLELSCIVTWSFVRGVTFRKDLWEARYEVAEEAERKYLDEMEKVWSGKSTHELKHLDYHVLSN